MLVLTRRTNQSIVIGDAEIRVTVLSCGNGRVKLGIEAPDEVPVHRFEVAAAIARNGLSTDPATQLANVPR